MNKYEKSKIYKIESLTSDKIYIGSTTNDYLCNRMGKHRYAYKRYKTYNELGRVSVYDIFNESGIENCFITLIENFKCNDINELRARESHYIKSLVCVNKNIPNRTLKEYYLDNIKTIREKQSKEYICECGYTTTVTNKSRHIKKCELKK